MRTLLPTGVSLCIDMYSNILTALCVCAVIVTADEVNFRPDYQLNANTKIFYKVHKVERTWSDAVAICKLEQAELALPLSEAQADVLKAKMDTSKTIWVGLHDKYSEGDFYTLNGVPATDIYTRWEAREPYYDGGQADCVKMDHTGSYSDALCDGKLLFICTKDQAKVKEINSCNTTDKDYILTPNAQNCYKLHTEARSWENALKTCNRELAKLVVIESSTETKLLTDNLRIIPANTLRKNHFNKNIFWLGFSDRTSNPGDYMTLDGKPLSEDIKWAQGKPGDAGEDERCVALQRDGNITLSNCDSLALFFCEKDPSTSTPNRIGS